MQLNEIDLNLLVTFDALLRERRVSRVAESIGLSQPAVSNALARLRRLLDDPLFVRTPAGMEPTPRARQLAAPVAEALATLHGALNQRSEFGPQASARLFRIGMSDIGEIYFLPRLMNAIAAVAPGVTVSTVRSAAVDLKHELESGHVDLAIGLLPALKGGFHQRRLFGQRYVCLFRRGHGLDRRKALTRADYTGHGQVDERLARRGVQRNIKLTVPHFVAVGHLLQHTELVATVPEKLAEALVEPFDLVFAPLPFAVPEIAINAFWHAKVHHDPASRWLRGMVADVFAERAS
jgi:DNA-binding transcriptional LysR family regulator